MAWLGAAALALLPASLGAVALGGGSGSAPELPRQPPISRASWEPQAGDLVFRASRGLVGERIRAASGHAAIYSHVGLVVTRAGAPAIVDVSPYGSGHVEFTGVTAFTTDPETSDLLIMRSAAALDRARLAAEAERLVAARTGFDYDFDMHEPGELYCAELAYNLLEAAGLDLSSVRWTDIHVPFTGTRRLVTPDALAHAAGLRPVFRRQSAP